jgi:murein DD-endopeptidase MepM/ murein hydrolase activator NlpD
MRRIPVLTMLCFALCCSPAAAQAVAPNFSVSPASVEPGKPVTFAFRANGSGSVRARVDLLAPGRPAVRAKLGRIRAGRPVSVAWTPPALPAGAYTARLVITARSAKAYERAPLAVMAPVVAATTDGVFPVQGAYGFGGADSRFGAARSGHTHQGQDIAAAEGTPVVSPRAGSVHWVAYQATGAGYYVVIRADDGRDFVFMHLQAGSTLVAKDQAVAAGQRIAAVGNTGESQGPHLHFEIWPGGWWASDASQPVDPLPQLQAWAG